MSSIFDNKKFNCKTQQQTIETYIPQFNQKYKMAEWQRENRWPTYYKPQLIISIIDGVDISKITIGSVGQIKYVIDGGHRSRTILEYMNNAFYISIGSDKIYYNEIPKIYKKNRSMRIFTPEEKMKFDEVHLDIVIYSNCSENDCRTLFGILQNTSPMSVADTINSRPQDIVRVIRDFCKGDEKYDVNGNNLPLKNHFGKISGLKTNKNNSMMHQLVSLVTVINPIQISGDDEHENEILSLKYAQEGLNCDASTLRYINNCNEIITEDTQEKILETILFIIKYGYENGNTIRPSVIWSLVHVRKYYSGKFNYDRFKSFTKVVTKYDNLVTSSEEDFKANRLKLASARSLEAINLNNKYKGNLKSWSEAATTSGMSERGMKKRLSIIKDHCFN